MITRAGQEACTSSALAGISITGGRLALDEPEREGCISGRGDRRVRMRVGGNPMDSAAPAVGANPLTLVDVILRLDRGRTASAWTSARPRSTPRSSATSCWSWRPWPSAPSPPLCSGTAPMSKPRRPQSLARCRHPDPGMIPLTVPEIKRLLASALARRHPEGHALRWLAWRRRHQARSRWFHQRTRLNREYTLAS
jgi:hypothetical protein